jgi:hypothetical protein
MRPPPPSHGPPQKAAIGASKSDGGNDAVTDDQRAVALHAGGAYRSRAENHGGADDISGRIAGAVQRAYDAAEHPLRFGTAGFLAII